MEITIDMDIPSECGLDYRRAYFVARVVFFLFGLGAAAWGAYQFASTQQEEPVERAASDLLKGRGFPSPTLMKLLARSDSIEIAAICSPSALPPSASLRVALVKYETADGKAPTDDAYFELYHRFKPRSGARHRMHIMWDVTVLARCQQRWLDAEKF